MKIISGKIIRIIDRRTVIINLGKNDGIKEDSVFSIMGSPEQISDPDTSEILGEVTIVKSRVKAKEVAEKFTIATTKWETYQINTFNKLIKVFADNVDTYEQDEGELLVEEKDIQPWKAKSESPVKVGDIVQVKIKNEVAQPTKELSENEQNRDEKEEK